jgi:hypothetical protein
MGRKTLLIIIFVVVAALAIINISLSKNKSVSTESSRSAILPAIASQLTSVDSPDGKLTLTMKKVKNGSGNTYSFSTAGKEIFSKSVDSSISFSIPENTWSPDKKYVFLKETGNAGSTFFVLSASIDSSSQDEQTANITDLFAKKYPDLRINDVTGWGGINLVVFNSDKSDGSKGSSFWFEAPSHAFIQLSTRF